MKRLEEIVNKDWANSHLLDLSDEALLADLKKRDLDPHQLALQEDCEHWGYHHNGHHDKGDGKSHEKHGNKDHEAHKHHAGKT